MYPFHNHTLFHVGCFGRQSPSTEMSLNQVSPSILSAARITVAFSGLYALTIVNVVVCKFRLLRKAKSEGESFNRYESKEMHTADRLSGNFLEWYPVFMGPLWAMALCGSLTDSGIHAAWTYDGLRGLYFILMVTFGVGTSGMNPVLWLSTLPAYCCLGVLFAQALKLF